MQDICCTCGTSNSKMYYISMKLFGYERTIKNMILLLVPEMEGRLQDTDMVCMACKRLMHQCLKFIARCLEVNENFKLHIIAESMTPQHETSVKYVNDQTSELSDKILEENTAQFSETSKIDTNDENSFTLSQCASEKDDKNAPIEEKVEQITVKSEDHQKSSHDYYKEQLAICELDKRPSSILERGDRILSVRLPQIVPEHFITSLIDMNINVLGCSENEEINLKNKRILLIGNPGQGLKCEHCSKIFSNAKYLKQHSLRHSDPVERGNILQQRKRKLMKQKFEAVKVKREKTQEEKFEMTKNGHEENRYAKPKSPKTNGNSTYVCHICGAVFKNSSGMSYHIKFVHCTEKVTCKLCSKVFKSNITLKRHIASTHMRLRMVQCEECGKKFTNRSSLKSHRSLVHQKEINFVCPVCGQGFSRPDYLKRHLRKHTGECETKPYTETRERRHKCSVCDMSFMKRANLVIHERRHLRDTKQFKCHVCWKTFADNAAYEEHMNNHQKPYVCQICNEGFGRRFALINHLYSDHPDEDNSVIEAVIERYPQCKRRSGKKLKIVRINHLEYQEEEPGEYRPEYDLESEDVKDVEDLKDVADII